MSAHTPGPWRWELNTKHHEVRLCGAAGYDLNVLDFVRWGMSGAAPRFRTEAGGAPQVMVRAESFGVVVPGREHHAEWFKTVSHPDAALIAAAPVMLEALVLVVAAHDGRFFPGACSCGECTPARAAIALSRGER